MCYSYCMALDGKHTNSTKKLTLCMATQWNIMETRKGEDLCHFLGKARQEKKKKKPLRIQSC